jgi:hypothetical protein
LLNHFTPFTISQFAMTDNSKTFKLIYPMANIWDVPQLPKCDNTPTPPVQSTPPAPLAPPVQLVAVSPDDKEELNLLDNLDPKTRNVMQNVSQSVEALMMAREDLIAFRKIFNDHSANLNEHLHMWAKTNRMTLENSRQSSQLSVVSLLVSVCTLAFVLFRKK